MVIDTSFPAIGDTRIATASSHLPNKPRICCFRHLECTPKRYYVSPGWKNNVFSGFAKEMDLWKTDNDKISLPVGKQRVDFILFQTTRTLMKWKRALIHQLNHFNEGSDQCFFLVLARWNNFWPQKNHRFWMNIDINPCILARRRRNFWIFHTSTMIFSLIFDEFLKNSSKSLKIFSWRLKFVELSETIWKLFHFKWKKNTGPNHCDQFINGVKIIVWLKSLAPVFSVASVRIWSVLSIAFWRIFRPAEVKDREFHWLKSPIGSWK